MIVTSNPYALCHQLSNGAETIIITVPQMQTHAPKGPRNPQILTDSALISAAAALRAKVVCNTSHPHPTPEVIAAICSRTCG